MRPAPSTARGIVARDFMVTRLVTLAPDMDAFEAIKLLVKHRISGAPVIDEHHHFLGVFSEKSVMKLLVDAAYDQLPSSRVGAFMNSDRGRTITETTSFLDIVQRFLHTPYRRLPVLRGELLVGQISRRDVLGEALELLKVAPEPGRLPLYLSALVDREQAPLE